MSPKQYEDFLDKKAKIENLLRTDTPWWTWPAVWLVVVGIPTLLICVGIYLVWRWESPGF